MKDNKLPQKMECCSDQELKNLLYGELDKEQPDRKTALRILEELEQREDQKQKCNKRKVSKSIWKAAIAAVVVLAFVFGAPPVFGAENIFQLIGGWTKDLFALHSPNETQQLESEYVFKTDNPGLQQLYDAVSAYGISERVVPTWLPEGFQLVELKESSEMNGPSLLAVFVRGNDSVILSLNAFGTDLHNKYPKNEETVIVHDVAGVKHYLVLNEGYWNAVWTADATECALVATLDIETIYCIINSIYTEES